MTSFRQFVCAGLADRVEDLAQELLGPRNLRRSSASEWRWGDEGTMRVTIVAPRRGHFHDDVACVGGDPLDLIRTVKMFSNADALSWAITWLSYWPEQERMMEAS